MRCIEDLQLCKEEPTNSLLLICIFGYYNTHHTVDIGFELGLNAKKVPTICFA